MLLAEAHDLAAIGSRRHAGFDEFKALQRLGKTAFKPRKRHGGYVRGVARKGNVAPTCPLAGRVGEACFSA